MTLLFYSILAQAIQEDPAIKTFLQQGSLNTKDVEKERQSS